MQELIIIAITAGHVENLIQAESYGRSYGNNEYDRAAHSHGHVRLGGNAQEGTDAQEFLGAGTAFGITIYEASSIFEPIAIITKAPGAFLVLAMLAAVNASIIKSTSVTKVATTTI